MLYFILIIILLSTLSLLEAIDRRLIPYGTGWVVFVILFLFAGSRPVGADNDSVTYMSIFDRIGRPADYFNYYLLWGAVEPLYYFIPSFLKYVFRVAAYGAVTFYIYSFLGCGIVMIAIRKLTPFFYTALLTLFCNYFLLQQMTQIRAAIAVGFFLLCIPFKVRKQWGPFCVCVFLSFLFHYSSILAFTLFFVSEKHLNKPLYVGLAVASFLASFVDFAWVLSLFNFGSVGALAQKQDAYLSNVQLELLNRRNYIFMIHLVNALVLICFSGRLYEHNRYIYLLIKLQVFGLLIFQLLSASPSISERIADYYWASHLITLPALLYLFRYKIWPAAALCSLNTAILLTLIYRNHIFDMNYYAVAGSQNKLLMLLCTMV